ncbi:hypothetical protein, partial [Halobacterium bonnevillei]
MTTKDSLAVLYVDDDRSRAATVAEELQRAAPGIHVQTATTRADAAAGAWRASTASSRPARPTARVTACSPLSA